MAKKLEKSIEGSIVKLKIIETNETITVDFKKLPQKMQDNLGPFGLGHKLGDAAAGKEANEIAPAINKIIEGLQNGDWSVRVSAGSKITKASIEEGIALMDPKDRDIARKLMDKIAASAKAKADKEAAAKK